MGRRIASESKQTVRGGPKPAKVGLHRRLITGLNQSDFSRAMPTPNLRTGMLGERDWLHFRIHSRTQSPSYARCDEGLWPNPKPDTIKTW